MPRVRYEVRVAGTLGPAGREAFADLGIDTEPTATVLSGDLDQAALHGLLDRALSMGLEIVDVTRVRQPARRPYPSADA